MSGVIEKKVEHFLNLPYTILVERHSDNGKPYYSARVLELEGCLTTGDTVEEVTVDIQDAMREWLRLNIKLGRTIPLPIIDRRYSGKIILRMPPSLHESLVFRAVKEGVSLNQYLVASLSHTLGFKAGLDSGKTTRPRKRRQKTKAS